MKIDRLLVSIGASALLMACAPVSVLDQGDAGIKPFEVKLEVADDGRGNPVLVNKNKKTKGCTKFPDEDKYRKGCIYAGPNETVEVDFKLSGSGGWYFATLEICSAPDLMKPDECELSDVQRADWLVLANAGAALPGADGQVKITDFGVGLKQFTLRDYNWRADTYVYRIQVCAKKADDNSEQCLWMDPGGENNGRGIGIK